MAVARITPKVSFAIDHETEFGLLAWLRSRQKIPSGQFRPEGNSNGGEDETLSPVSARQNQFEQASRLMPAAGVRCERHHNPEKMFARGSGGGDIACRWGVR